MLKKHSLLIGIICAALNMLPWVYFTAYYIYSLCHPDSTATYEHQGLAIAFALIIIVPVLLVSAAGLLGSLLVRKKPTAGIVLMLVSGAFVFLVAPFWWLKTPPMLLIVAGIFALISAVKTPSCKPQNESPVPPS